MQPARKAPRYNTSPTENEKSFSRGCGVRQKQIADPATKALYQPRPDSKFTSAYAAALADYLKRPVIDEVDISGYRGNEGDVIIVKATDVARTLTVAVAILDVDGKIQEQGEALPNAFTLDYVFKASRRNDLIRGSRIRVTVNDKPGNVVAREMVV